MIERRKEVLEAQNENVERRDPSANVVLLVGNVKEYLECLHKQSDDFYEKRLAQNQEFINAKLQLAIEASQRERKTESDRIDALREVDRKAVEVANEQTVKRAELLASQMIENNEAFRTAMAEQAKTNAAMVQQVANSLDARLKIVETNQYTLAGASKGGKEMWGWIVGVVAIIITIIKFFMDLKS